ncbi:MAG: ATP-binding protein, partial [Bacteroidales bacterium]
NIPPYEYVNDKGQKVGFNVELTDLLMKGIGYEYELEFIRSATGIENLQSGKADLISSLVNSEKRSKLLHMSRPCGYLHKSLITRKGSRIRTMNDLIGKEVLVQAKGVFYDQLIAENFPCQICAVDDITEGFRMLSSGLYDVLICGHDFARTIVVDNNYMNLEITLLETTPYSFSFGSLDDELIRRIDRQLELLKKSGAYGRLYEKWFGIKGSSAINRKIWLIVASLSALIFLLLLFSCYLRLRIKKAIREIEERNQKISIAIRNGQLSIWGFDVSKCLFYNIEGHLFPQGYMTYEQALSYVHPQDLERVEKFHQVILNERPQYAHIELRSGDITTGEYSYYRNDIAFIRGKDGQIETILGACRNQTKEKQHKQIEHQLLRSLQTAIKSTGLQIWHYEVESGILYVIRDLFLEKTNYNMDSLRAQIHPEDQDTFYNAVQEMLKGRVLYEKIIVRGFNKKSDSYDYYECVMNALTNEADRVYRIIASQKNITERQNRYLKQQAVIKSLDMAMEVGKIISWIHYPETGRTRIFYGRGSVEKDFSNLKIEDMKLHPEDMEIYKAFYNQMYHGDEKEGTIIVRCFCAVNKIYRPYEVAVRVEKDAAGNVKCFSGVKKDISDIHYWQEQHSQKLDLLKTIYDNVSAGLVFYDKDGWMLEVNQCFSNFFGVQSREELIGKVNYFGLDYISAETKEQVRSGEAVSYIITYADFAEQNSLALDPNLPHGEYFEIQLTPVCHPDNQVYGYLAICNDVTERIEKEKKLFQLNKEIRDYAAKLRYILKSSGILLWDYDIKEKIMSLYSAEGKEERVTFDNYVKGVSQDQHAKVHSLFEQMNAREISNYKDQRKYHDPVSNKRSYVMINGMAIRNEADEIISYSGVRRDITELIETQLSLQIEKEKAQQADRLKSAFLANMSHEIRTPLNAIIGFTELVQIASSDEERQEYIRIINNNNDLLLRLVGDILDLSKIESGMLELQPDLFDFAAFFQEQALYLSEHVNREKVIFSMESPFSECMVSLDKNRIAQVLANFMTNAIKYTDSGSITMGYEYIDNGLRFHVTDTGKGIPAEKHDLLFRRFEKLDSMVQGVGLGLSISKAIIEAMGGKIGFTSNENQGSCFWAWVACQIDPPEE